MIHTILICWGVWFGVWLVLGTIAAGTGRSHLAPALVLWPLIVIFGVFSATIAITDVFCSALSGEKSE